jgi:1,4-alpha-glucan branching enzyme
LLADHHARTDRRGILCAPYDAELFGHWWFEGPLWLEFLIRKIAFDQKTVKMVTPSEYLAEHPRNQVLTPSMSSWGWLIIKADIRASSSVGSP